MSMLIDTTEASVTSEVLEVPFSVDRGKFRPVQVDISASADVTVQGRVEPSMDWRDIESFTASSLKLMGIPREVRVVVANNTGTVKVAVDDEG